MPELFFLQFWDVPFIEIIFLELCGYMQKYLKGGTEGSQLLATFSEVQFPTIIWILSALYTSEPNTT